MRKVTVRSSTDSPSTEDADRLLQLLAAGLERLFAQKASGSRVVDFVADVSVTTDCPKAGGSEEAEE